MKKILSVILTFALLIPAACFGEEIDLSGYSFAELAALRDRIQMEMMTRDEWQEVTVPAGLWEVGVDIPAGAWLVRCADENRDDYLLCRCEISCGVGKPDGANGFWDTKKSKGRLEIHNPLSSEYGGETSEYIITVEVGDYIFIHPLYNKAVFSAYTGKPGFVFK